MCGAFPLPGWDGGAAASDSWGEGDGGGVNLCAGAESAGGPRLEESIRFRSKKLNSSPILQRKS